jgi:hypothetical protein
MKNNSDLVSRRDMLKRSGVAAAAIVASPLINRGRFRLFAGSSTEYSGKAIDLVGRATVIDMLSVLTLDFNKQNKWFKGRARPGPLRSRQKINRTRISRRR